MAYPVLASTSTATIANAPLVITNPSGLTAGDEMVLFVTMYETGSSQSVNTPSGWTSKVNSLTNFVSKACFTKTATAGDVSAGSVTVTSSGGADHFSGSLHRITGSALGSEIAGVEFDDGGTTSSVATFTTALTPVTAESLVIIYFGGADNSLASTPTGNSYSLTPTITLTEAADVGRRDGASDGIAHVVAYGDYDGQTEITSRSFTLSEDITRAAGSIAIVYSAPQNATGTNALLSVSPTTFSQNGVAGGIGTNALLSVSPTLNTQSGTATVPSVWTTITKS